MTDPYMLIRNICKTYRIEFIALIENLVIGAPKRYIAIYRSQEKEEQFLEMFYGISNLHEIFQLIKYECIDDFDRIIDYVSNSEKFNLIHYKGANNE